MMRSKRYAKDFAVTVVLVLLALSTSCASNGVGGLPSSGAVTPVYTPIVMIPTGTAIPSSASLVSIEDLVAHPEQYADKFIEVHGFNASVYAKPACYPLFGPPSEWLLVSAPTIYKENVAVTFPARIEVKNTFGGMISQPSDVNGRAMRSTLMKQAIVWGWWRLYEGPIGCGTTNLLGTPNPMQIQQTWYLDAVKLQYLESIEVPTPAKK